MRASIHLFAAAALASVAAAIPTISAKGSKFFKSDGSQYFIKGVAYQLTPADPLADAAQCALDAEVMKTLGANAIRVYHVDPTADHKGCMSTLADAGIYLFVDLDTFDTQIEPGSPHWNQTQRDAFAAVMDEFEKYENTAGFFVGNEVLTNGDESNAAPFVKAAARDMKAYRDSKGYRKIPVGYSATDLPSLRTNLQNYLACGTNQSEALDFFSLNAYEWCGASSYEVSGYANLQKNATGYNIPLFFSETGCTSVYPRDFSDQAAIFGDQMSGTWSGAIIYEWIQEENGYGLISYGPAVSTTVTGPNIVSGFTVRGTPMPKSPDFEDLSKQWKTLSPSSVSESDYTPQVTPPPCPAYTSKLWEVDPVSLPSLAQVALAGTATSGAGASATSRGAAFMPTAMGRLQYGLGGLVIGAAALL